MNSATLKRVNLFSGLAGEELDRIISFSNVKKYNKGEMIFFDTEPYTGFYCVIEGKVKVFKISKEGKEHILHIMMPYNTFAEVPLFEKFEEAEQNNLTYPANAMAIEEDTVVIRIPSKMFISLLYKTPSLSLKLLSGMSKRLRSLNKHIEDLTLSDVSKRLARYLLRELGNRDNVNASAGSDKPLILTLSVSKQDLASYLGTINETLSRTFNKFQKEDLISVKGKEITIKDLQKLKKLSE